MTEIYNYENKIVVLGSSSNVSLIGVETMFKAAEESFGCSKETAKTVISIVSALICFGLAAVFFRTHLGLCIRATGDNEAMVSASSINVDAMKITALSFSNALVAVSGGLIAQYQGFADVNSGSGMLVVGLASVIYRYIIAAATKSSFFPAYAPSGSASGSWRICYHRGL